MTTTLVIAARELRERTFVLLTAASIAVLPFPLALLPASKRFGTAGFIAVVGGVSAVVFTLCLALIVGASMVGRELSDRRLSFYFSRPVSGTSIWFGKFIGAVVLTSVTFAIIFVPSFLAGRSGWSMSWPVDAAALAGITLAVSVIFILNAHALSTIIRSRSPLVAADFVAAAILGTIIFSIIWALLAGGAQELTGTMAGTLLVGGTLSLLAAGAWQLSRGRAEVRRSHGEMSRFLWIAFGSLVVIAGLYTVWVVAVEAGDLRDPHVLQSPNGGHAVIAGESPMRGDYHGAFLVDATNGESRRVPLERWGYVEFTHEGNAAIWVSDKELLIHRFGIDDEPIETGIAGVRAAVLSADRRRAGVVQDSSVSINDLDSQRLLVSAAIPKGLSGIRLYFVSGDVLRIIGFDGGLHFFELNTETRQLVKTGEWRTTSPQVHTLVTEDGSSVFVTRLGEDGQRVFLLDARTGELKGTFPIRSASQWHTRRLHDGRIVVLTGDHERVVKVLSPDGATVREIALGSATRARLVNATASGKLVFTMTEAPLSREVTPGDWRIVVVDPDRGVITRREDRLQAPDPIWSVDPRTAVANETGDFIVTAANGQLFRWNAETGQKTPLLRG